MQKNLVSLICTLALLAFLMPATTAEESLNATANTTLNTTLNETQNATASIMLNATSNLTEESLTPAESPDITATEPAVEIPESSPFATQLGTGNAAPHSKVLRAGFEKTKPVNNLDVYGNKSTYNIPFSASPSIAFNASQRLGNVSQFTYNTNNYKPIYNISQYSRTKPLYEVPGTISSKPVYSISGYPNIKTVNSIP
jgi:hypothetical protein